MSKDIYTKEEIDSWRGVTYRDAGAKAKWIRTCDAKDERMAELQRYRLAAWEALMLARGMLPQSQLTENMKKLDAMIRVAKGL